MATWINHVTIAAPRNGTTSHTVGADGTGGTVVGGTAFTPTAGRYLLAVCEGPVTFTTPTGYSLGASAINNTGLYAFYRASATGTTADRITTTHNGSNYACVFDFYEFASGSAWTNGVGATNLNATGASTPSLTGLTGTHWAGYAAARDYPTGTTEGTIAWTAPAVEETETNTPPAATDGYTYSLASNQNVTGSSTSGTWTVTGANFGTLWEALTIAQVAATGGTTQSATAAQAVTAGLTATGAASKGTSAVLAATLAASTGAQVVRDTAANSAVSAGLSATASVTKSVSANLGLTANLSADAAIGTGLKTIDGSLTETVTATATALVNKGSGVTSVTATGLAASVTTVKGSSATRAITAGLSAAVSVTKSVSGSLAETVSLSADATVGIAPQQIAGTLSVSETASAQASLVKPASVLAVTTANLAATAAVVKSISGSIVVNTALTATEARTFGISAMPLTVTFSESALAFLQGPVVGGTATNLERSTYEAISNAAATATATAYVPSAPSAEGR